MTFALEQQADRDRRQGSRQSVGRQHRKHDGKSERREQVLGRSVEEHHRGEHAADGKRRNQRRHRDFGGAVQRRLGKRHALFGPQTMGVLDGHGRIVDQYADRQRKAAERHGVQRFAEKVQHDERRQDRQRDRNHHDQRRAPRTQEDQDHQRGEAGRDGAFAQHAVDRVRHEHRLIEQLVDLESGRRGGADRLQRLLHAVDDRQRRGIAVLDDAEQDRAVAVLAHDVLLHQRSVADLRHVLQEDGGAVDELDRHHVEVVDRRRCRVGSYRILGVSDLRRSRRQRQVLGIDRIHDVERRQSPGQQLVRVDIDHDLAILAAGRRRQRDAGNRRQLLSNAVDAEIVELLLVQAVRIETELQHGNARRIELHDDRRLDAGRHQRANGVGRGDDLRDGEVEIDVRLEVDLLDRQTVEGLRFHVLDAVDVGADGILAVGADALFHFRRGEAGVLPDDRHHRNTDFRKDIRRHRSDRGDAEKQDQRRHHVERVRKSQRESNNAHGLSFTRAPARKLRLAISTAPARLDRACRHDPPRSPDSAADIALALHDLPDRAGGVDDGRTRRIGHEGASTSSVPLPFRSCASAST